MPATIIIPAYNEEQGITEVLEELCGVFDDGAAVEILVVDDASTDQTAQKTEEFISSKSDWNGSLRLIRHETNRGYGASLKSGVRESEHEHIVITDADGTYPAPASVKSAFCDMRWQSAPGLAPTSRFLWFGGPQSGFSPSWRTTWPV